MAKQLRRSPSKLPEDGVVPGCLWGLFHSFDIHQRLRLRKILGERGSTAHGRRAIGIKGPKMKVNVPPAGHEHDLTEADPNISVEDRSDAADKASGKAQMRAMIAQEISKQQDVPKQKGQKRKVTPFATRLLRTISIHHMECNDYAHPNETPNDSQIQESSLLSHNSNFSASNEHMLPLPEAADECNKGKRCEVCGTISSPAANVGHKKLDVLGYQLLEKQALLREKLREAKISLLGQQKGEKELLEDFALHRSNDVLEALELFNANNELFLKLLQEPGMIMSNYFQRQKDSRSGIVLTKSSSFPGAGFSARSGDSLELQNETVPFRKQKRKSDTETLQSLANINLTKSDKSHLTVSTLGPAPCTRGFYETANSEILSSFTHEVRCQRNSGTAAHHFKVIKQRIKDLIRENRRERQRISMDRVLHKIPYGCSKASQNIKGETSCLWEGPDSDRCDGDSSINSLGSDVSGSTNRNTISHVQRSHSLTESLERYSSLLGSSSSREPRRQASERLKLAREDGDSQAPRPTRTFGSIFSLPEFASFKDNQSEVSRDLFHSRSTSIDLSQGNEAVDINGTEEQSLSRSLDFGVPDTSTSDFEAYVASDVFTTESIVSTPLNEHTSASCIDVAQGGGTSAEPGSIAIIDSSLAEHHVSPAEFSAIQAGSVLKADQIHFEQDPWDSPHNQSDASDFNIIETDGSNDNNILGPAGMQLDFDSLDVPVDNKHAVEFHYVRDMLKAYLFGGNGHSERWSLPSNELNHSVSEEVEGADYESESNGYSDISLDRELLYDLTNQVLLEICESSYDHCPWLSHVGFHIRPIPVGYHLLEEVWANISWHLKSQPHANPTLEYILERDFKKSDGWMNLTYDIEYVGLDLEALLLDDLLDEAIIEFLDSDNQECPVA